MSFFFFFNSVAGTPWPRSLTSTIPFVLLEVDGGLVLSRFTAFFFNFHYNRFINTLLACVCDISSFWKKNFLYNTFVA